MKKYLRTYDTYNLTLQDMKLFKDAGYEVIGPKRFSSLWGFEFIKKKR